MTRPDLDWINLNFSSFQIYQVRYEVLCRVNRLSPSTLMNSASSGFIRTIQHADNGIDVVSSGISQGFTVIFAIYCRVGCSADNK